MREKLTKEELEKELLRITPAYAGKTACFASSSTIMRDHPRVCGKNTANNWDEAVNMGSPPRMREKLQLPSYLRLLRRITPAYAGKTVVSIRIVTGNGDHPRVCGKNLSPISIQVGIEGSPPRMREKLKGLARLPRCPRITPAYAGKTLSITSAYILLWDHPRVCGKNPKCFILHTDFPGITPAYAGKTTADTMVHSFI